MKWIEISTLSLLLFVGTLGANENFEKLSHLKVTGNSRIQKPANQFSIRISVVTKDAHVQSALASNNDKMQRLLEALKNAGLTEKEYKTGSFTIEPQYSSPPKEIPPNWQSTINGYEVRNTLSIKSTKLDLVGAIIDAVTREGANQLDDLIFSIDNIDQATSEAIALAVKQAQSFAEAAAKGADVNLGRVLEIEIHPSEPTPRFFKANRLMATSEGVSTPIAPGDVDVTASVSVVYEID